MITLVPYPSFEQSARTLDWQDLSQQRIDALEILRALLAPPEGWVDHPAITMWEQHGLALVCYTLTICDEWAARTWLSETGYSRVEDPVRDTVIELVAERFGCSQEAVETLAAYEALTNPELVARTGASLPWWVGHQPVHASHRSLLLRRNPVWYQQHGWGEPDGLPLLWPSATQPGHVNVEPET
jgi:hypothetical protein